MDELKLINVLALALRAPNRPASLRILARPKYLPREIALTPCPDGSVRATLYKWGFQYKHRGRRPHTPILADTQGIQIVLNNVLQPEFYVSKVEDEERYVAVFINIGRLMK